MKYLVDANVLSEPTKPRPADHVIAWLRAHDADLVINPIILGELQYGMLLLPRGQKRQKLLEWFEHGVGPLKVIEIDAATASIWGRLLADLRRKGRSMPIKDSLIAATARQHGFTVATGNVADFQHVGIPVVNPFDAV